MPYLQLSDDLSIHYEDIQITGSPTVLLLHGLGVNCASWGMQVPALQEAGFRILTPDMRGFGNSAFSRGNNSIRHFTQDMLALLQTLNVSSAIVVGISMGGTVALQMAIDKSAIVSKLVLINTFATLRPKRLGTWFYFASRFVLAHIVGIGAQANTVAHHLFPDPKDEALRKIFIAQLTRANPSGYRAAMRALARFNVSKDLNQIAIPTLVISGEQDTTVPLETQEFLADNIPGARHEIVPGAGHAITIEEPARINRLLINFILDNSLDITG